MLYCRYCDFLKSPQNADDKNMCNLHLCEFADYILSNESIDELCNPPCYNASVKK